jgi:hypothetical protein
MYARVMIAYTSARPYNLLQLDVKCLYYHVNHVTAVRLESSKQYF